MDQAVDGLMGLVTLIILVVTAATLLVFAAGYRVGRLTAERDSARADLKDLRKRTGQD